MTTTTNVYPVISNTPVSTAGTVQCYTIHEKSLPTVGFLHLTPQDGLHQSVVVPLGSTELWPTLTTAQTPSDSSPTAPVMSVATGIEFLSHMD